MDLLRLSSVKFCFIIARDYNIVVGHSIFQYEINEMRLENKNWAIGYQ